MSQEKQTTVAFIGLGNMGSPMASNLLKAGFNVRVHDRVEALSQALGNEGAKVCDNIKQVLDSAEVVVTMLPAGEHVKQVYLGTEQEPGIIDLVSNNAFLIDCSTIDPDSARLVSKNAQDKGLEFVDAPVSGGVAAASAGTLTFIVGGSDKGFTKANNLLSFMGKNVFHAGKAGDGQMAKVCNNLILGSVMAATCESLSLGMDNGLNPEVLSNIILQSSGRNWVLELYNPCPGVIEHAPASAQYTPGFMCKLMSKDLGLGLEAAKMSQSSVPMGALAHSLYALHNRNGNAELDFSSLFEFFRNKQ
ncbi:3-hydroxyisobutyrate dehydrogenase [Vibrio sp. 10N]|uniref:3-hydroxyisobutyrate dehydrogenase n=1 Tax=Vibrio sp. 10N TaxID=3058938 RepID=UPI002813C91E|nr:3-hydroxyisobutyrate dehydrogenase [Vibrio sp. 10N]